VLLVLLSKEAS